MATKSAALSVEQGYLTKMWFAAVTVVLVAVAAIALSFALTGNSPAGGTSIKPVKDYGPVEVQNEPIVVNGTKCAQCR